MDNWILNYCNNSIYLDEKRSIGPPDLFELCECLKNRRKSNFLTLNFDGIYWYKETKWSSAFFDNFFLSILNVLTKKPECIFSLHAITLTEPKLWQSFRNIWNVALSMLPIMCIHFSLISNQNVFFSFSFSQPNVVTKNVSLFWYPTTFWCAWAEENVCSAS